MTTGSGLRRGTFASEPFYVLVLCVREEEHVRDIEQIYWA
jgi:hypothetical protein